MKESEKVNAAITDLYRNEFTKKIICIGDSNTYGYDPRNFFADRYDHPWPLALSDMTGDEIINMGMNGREIPHNDYQILDIDEQIGKELPVDAIYVLLGTNDLLNTFPVSAEKAGIRMEYYIRHLKEKYAAANIFLMVPVEIHHISDAIEIESKKLVKIYMEIAKKHGIEILDLNELDLQISFDQVHFTEDAHGVLAEYLSKIG